MKRLHLVFAASLVAWPAPPLSAATRIWDGSANGNWSVGANWSGGTAPAAGDDLVFPDIAAVRRNTTNNFILGSAAFGSLRFSGSGYRIYGAVIALTNGIQAIGPSLAPPLDIPIGLTGTNIINAPIEVRAAQTFRQLSYGDAEPLLDINGDIALGPHTLTLDIDGAAHLSGAIVGSGGITTSGDVRLDGIAPNTFTGPTRVTGGTLELNKGLFGGVTAVPGELFAGFRSLGSVSDVPGIIRLLRDDQIADASAVTLTNLGRLDLNGSDDTIGPLTMAGGRVDTDVGTLTLGGNITATSAGTNYAVIDGNLSLGAGTKTFTVNPGPEYYDLVISAVVSGTPGFRKMGTGFLLMNRNNTYSGATSVQEGIIFVAEDNALGSTVNGTIVDAGASLVITATARVGAEALVLQGDGWTPSTGALQSSTFSNSWAGPITLPNDSTIGVGTTAFLNLSGVISGSGGLTKLGEGTLIFSGGASNTYSGDTRVHEGTLLLQRNSFDRSIQGDLFIGDGAGGAASDVVRIEGSAQINNDSAVTIAASGLFDQNTPSEVIGSLAGFGRVDLAGNQLITGGNWATTSYGGQILGTFNFVKTGPGAMTLTGDNPFSGTLIPTLGTLIVNGSQPRSDVTVQAAGGVGGRGTVGHIGAYGTVTPGAGAGPGILTCSNLTLLPGSDYFVGLSGPAPGTGYDQLNVRGDVVLSGADLHVSVLQPPPVSGVFIIIANDGSDPVTGVFTGLPNGAQFADGGLLFRISYTGGDGNDVVLTRVSAPASTLTEFGALSDGSKRLRGVGLPGLTYSIEAATNLNAPIPWVVIGEDQANNAGLYEWIDIDAPLHPRRFYRTQSP